MSYGNYPDLSQVKKILVIKLRHLGDLVLTTPVFTILKKQYPDMQIDAYIYQEGEVIIKNNPYLTKIWCQDKGWKKLSIFRRIRNEVKLLKNIRKEKYDCVINLTDGDRGALISRLSRAKYKVGWDPNNRNRKIYSHLVKGTGNPRHTVEKNLDALRKMGIFFPAEEKKLVLRCDENHKALKQLLSEKNFANYVLIHPASRWRFKCWPVQKFASFAKQLVDLGHKLVFTAGTADYEKEMVKAIVHGLPEDKYLDFSGKLSIEELIFLVKKAGCVITVDTFVLHIASAFEKRCVAIFGPTSDINWGPWMNPYATVVTKSISCRPCNLDGCGGSKISQCLYELEVMQVMKAFEKVMHLKEKSLHLGSALVPEGY